MAPMPRDRSVLWISAGFVIAGVILLVVAGDDPESRAAGMLALVFFGGLGLVYWWVTRPRPARGLPSPSTFDVGELSGARRFVPTGRATGVVIVERPGRMVAALVGSGVFIASGALMLWSAPVASPRFAVGLTIAGASSIVVFGPAAVLAGFAVVRGRGLALLPDGVLTRQAAGSAFVPWAALTEIRVLSVHGQAMLGLVVGPEARLTGSLRALRPLQRRWFGSDVVVTTSDPFAPSSLGRVLGGLACRPSLRARLADHRGVATVMRLASEPAPHDDGAR